MAEQAPRTLREVEAELVERTWKDQAFRQALLEDPKGTLQRELGVSLPDEVSITVLEESPTNRYVIVPPRPASGEYELEDAELEAAAGGWDPTVTRACTCDPPKCY
jgi:hypothetical protein